MLGFLGPIIGGLISAAGSFGTSTYNADQTAKNNALQMQFNAAEAEKNRQFQAEMSNTAYQRGMADMKAAGLNPILAYQKGGASAPSGGQATASLTAPHIPADIIPNAVNSALSIASNQAQVALLKAQTIESSARALSEAEKPALIREQTDATQQEARLKGQTRIIRMPEEIRGGYDADTISNEKMKTVRAAGTIAEETSRVLDPFVNGAKAISSLRNAWSARGPRRTTIERSDNRGGSSFEERFQY